MFHCSLVRYERIHCNAFFGVRATSVESVFFHFEKLLKTERRAAARGSLLLPKLSVEQVSKSELLGDWPLQVELLLLLYPLEESAEEVRRRRLRRPWLSCC